MYEFRTPLKEYDDFYAEINTAQTGNNWIYYTKHFLYLNIIGNSDKGKKE